MERQETAPALTSEQMKVFITDQRYQLIARMTPWVCLVFIAWLIKQSIVALAGAETGVTIALSAAFTHNITVSITVAFFALFGISGCLYGALQRKLRRDNIERLQGRIRFLEERFDSERTSSHLTSRGETNPLDKIGGR